MTTKNWLSGHRSRAASAAAIAASALAIVRSSLSLGELTLPRSLSSPRRRLGTTGGAGAESGGPISPTCASYASGWS